MGGGGGGASWKFKKAAKKIFVQTCGSFCQTQLPHLHNSTATTTICCDSPNYSSPPENQNRNIACKKILSEISGQGSSSTSPTKNLCTICLEPLNYSSGSSPGQAIFTAQCSHSFHFACISSNVSHGSITCPICRAHWTQLPRNLTVRFSNKAAPAADPILQILDDSIANSRVHRQSFLRSARYNNDEPVDPSHTIDQPRLNISLVGGPHRNSSCLRVKLARQPGIDLVLVASPNGPHLRLMKQAMALVVFSLRHVDRLAVVTYSSAAARVFPLRRMTSYGKRTALQVIDRLFYMGAADPMEGLKKGVKILVDRVHMNPNCCILHLTDTPARPPSYRQFDMEVPVTIQWFQLGIGFGASSIMLEFEEFLAGTLGGAIRDIQMRIGEGGGRIVRIGELRGGEERNIPVYLGECGPVCVEYSYAEGGDGECVIRRGEVVVVVEDKGENGSEDEDDGVSGGGGGGGRMSGGGGGDQCWEYHDPFMARRWAKHLHGYRL